MGIRIRKVLGYGTDMTYSEAAALLNGDVQRNLNWLSGSDYHTFLQKKYSSADPSFANKAYHLNDLRRLPDKDFAGFTADDLVTVVGEWNVEQEGTKPKKRDRLRVIITPPAMVEDWKHYDDAIDYYEEVLKYAKKKKFNYGPRIQYFDQGLFPYEGGFINHRTGEEPDAEWVRYLKSYVRDSSEKEPNTALVENILKLAGLASVEELDDIHPAPPIPVVDIAEWTGIFNNPLAAKKLRPALLTYWS